MSKNTRPGVIRALRFVWESAPGWTAASAAVLIIQGLLPVLTLYLTKRLVDAAAAGIAASDKAAAFQQVGLYVALSAAIALVGALCGALTRLVSGAQAQAVTDYMQALLQAKSVEVDLEYYENPQYHDTMHRAQQEAPFRPTRIVTGMAQLVQNGIAVLGIAGLLLSFHWVVGLILVAGAVPAALARLTFSRRMYAWQRKRTPEERQTWYLHWLLTRDTHAKEIRLFGLGSLLMQWYREMRRQLRRERLVIDTQRSMVELAAETLAVGAVFGLYAFVGYRTVHGFLTLGGLVMCLQAVQRGQAALGQILSSASELYENNLFLSSLYDFLDLKPRIIEPAHPQPVSRPMRTGLVFDHVSFEYPSSARKALEDVTLTIRPGEHVAFVGENGAGKTTLVKLLCRLYDPTGGAITLDGVDLKQLEIEVLRREISVVFQDYVRYHLTAQENIWLGDVERPLDSEQIIAAARQAGAHEVIARLKNGYDTMLGRWFSDGEELSVGEWQKVALARAFLRDSQILVLDEPTSAMDAGAEYELFRRFHRLAEGRTAILISHRLSTVRMADRIYVLEGGRIAECGTHDELVYCGGRYAHLFETQAQNYR
jgi:ATP-binding cassette, subfamily B, bacterial